MAQMGKKEDVPVHYTSLSGGEQGGRHTDEFGNPIIHTEIHQTDEHGNPVYHASEVHQTEEHNKPVSHTGRHTDQHGEPVHYHPSLKGDQGAQQRSGAGAGAGARYGTQLGVGTQGVQGIQHTTPGLGTQGRERVQSAGVGAAGAYDPTKANITYAGTEGGGGQERWDKNETPGSTGAYPTRANIPYAGADVDVGAEQQKKQEQRHDPKSTTEKVKEMLPGTHHH